ncbi:hypothetical protein [Desulfolutivibrio sulfoxidireducens]|uniref:hypothetical protein n=1 Tax=Desulfolutivibrio sulfoxidireducens TaxID=2773299 RepID=UPI00159E50C3|nr:hypothetical protein [Desulfolutivibrio sulfoxidireducens]QLA18646.1 hypothetical protein GD604_02315 [Desulfolutivibrio sulfoxidireducens]
MPYRTHQNRELAFLGIPHRSWPWIVGLGLLAVTLILVVVDETRAAQGPVGEEEEALAAMRRREESDATLSGLGLESAGSAIAPANVSGTGMAVWRDEIKASYDMPHFGFDAGYVGSHYLFSKTGNLLFAGRRPFEHLHRLEAGVTVRGGLWGNVTGFAGFRGSLGFERDPGRGYEGTALAGLAFPLGGSWTMTLGGGASINKVEVQPAALLGFRYDAGGAFAADLGFPRTEITWRGGPWWALRLTGGLDAGFYALSGGNPVAPDGYVSLLSPQGGLWLDLRPLEGLVVSLGGLYSLPGTMSIYRESGSRLKRLDVGGAPGGGLRLRYEF